MKTIISEQVIFWDCDDTLGMWQKPIKKGQTVVSVTCPYTGEQKHLRVHEPHIEILKARHARGATNIVWSANGYQWATALVKALAIQEYVSYTMSKPIMFVDDKPANAILGEHLYLSPDCGYGK